MNKKIIWITSFIVVLLVFSGVAYFQYQEHLEDVAVEKAQQSVAGLYEDKKQSLPKDKVNEKMVLTANKSVKKVKDQKIKKALSSKVEDIDDFIKMRTLLLSFFNDKVLKVEIVDDQLNKAQTQLLKLPKSFQPKLEPVLSDAKNQWQGIDDVKKLIRSLFDDEEMTIVAQGANRDVYTSALEKLNALPQRVIIDTYTPILASVEVELSKREEEENRRIEAEREAAIQLAIREAQEATDRANQEVANNEKIQAANVMLEGVPYYNQVAAGLPNGCECASLLMALHYKGYASGVSLNALANACPRSDDPHLGFVFPMDSYWPNDRVHWIAPDALSKFGSEYGNVVNISGCSTAALKSEIDNGNPVVVYGTYGFRDATGWDGEVPLNLHVMTLIGYNPLVNTYTLLDPYAGKIVIMGDRFEKIFAYNRFAISVR